MDVVSVIMVFGPAAVGLVTLVVGIWMLKKPKHEEGDPTARNVIAAICLLVTLGIGACYGLWWLRPNR